jgi:hypothetical protein
MLRAADIRVKLGKYTWADCAKAFVNAVYDQSGITVQGPSGSVMGIENSGSGANFLRMSDGRL